MKNTKKLNEGCLKIFRLLQLLYEDKAEYNDVIEIFMDESYDQTPNNLQVNINKYFNTLKIFGIKVKKEKNKFKLLSGLYSMYFTMDDLKSISLIMSYLNYFPEIDMTQNIEKFLESIEIRMNNEDKKTIITILILENKLLIANKFVKKISSLLYFIKRMEKNTNVNVLLKKFYITVKRHI